MARLKQKNARKICPQILPKSWRFPGFLTGNMAIVFENFPKSSFDHVAWDVNLFIFIFLFWFFGFLGLSKMASFRHKKTIHWIRGREHRHHQQRIANLVGAQVVSLLRGSLSSSSRRKWSAFVLFCFVMLVLVLFACCAAASVCGYRRQLHGFICWLWRRWRTWCQCYRRRLCTERERERCVCVYVSARAVNARCDQELEACDITRQLPGFVRALMF